VRLPVRGERVSIPPGGRRQQREQGATHMNGEFELTRPLCIFAAAAAATLPAAAAAQNVRNEGVIDVVIVTAQKREEQLVDVPIAVAAFNEEALARQQIDQATDLQLNVPNVSYTKTNFTGSNFQIRGIGVSSVGASGDSGVETHFNSMPIKNPRLFETEYFDIERVEVLRGPQGTLYGRNATGGAVNVIARKPQKEFGGALELDAGDYSSFKAKGAINLPLGENFAARFAAYGFQRDGYSENLYTGNDIDGRDQYAARGALRFRPSDSTDLTLTVNYYDEDSDRARVTKQMCHRDPAGAYGCLPDRLAFEGGNMRGTLGGNLAEFGPLLLDLANDPAPLDGLFAGVAPLPPALVALGTDVNLGAIVPADMRKTYAEFDPVYRSDETIATLEFSHDFGRFTFTSLTGYQDTSYLTQTDYNWTVAPIAYNGPAAALLTAAFGGVPISEIDGSLLGSLNGAIRNVAGFSRNYDQSDQEADQWSQELRLSSELDGPVNFQIGLFYFETDDETSYYVVTSELDYWAQVTRAYAPFVNSAPPYYINETALAGLESSAIFGELYWDMTESFKWTAGLRYTIDDKEIVDRQMLFSNPVSAPPTSTAFNDYRRDDAKFEEFTGRFGFDWKPGWFDDSTLYAFYSRGYKAGGFNPPLDRSLPQFAGTAEVYEPEFIDALEIGSKNILAGGRMQANLTAFYYDYQGLQVSKIVARTSVNENVDARIYGLEGEFILSPVDDFLIDANISYLKTEIQDFTSIDPRDPSNGDPAWTTLKDVSDGSNCVLATAQAAPARAVGLVLPAALGGPFGFCGPLAANGFTARDGVAADLDGNQLPSAPELSFKIGAQYTLRLGSSLELTARADYYWRDDFYARIFNRPIDRIESWDVLNAQLELGDRDGDWYVRGYVYNAMDDDHLTGMYVTDASSGLFTNVFSLDPRTYGLAIGFRF
jgi:outer membrane receptor protein involved in Fe transport